MLAYPGAFNVRIIVYPETRESSLSLLELLCCSHLLGPPRPTGLSPSSPWGYLFLEGISSAEPFPSESNVGSSSSSSMLNRLPKEDKQSETWSRSGIMSQHHLMDEYMKIVLISAVKTNSESVLGQSQNVCLTDTVREPHGLSSSPGNTQGHRVFIFWTTCAALLPALMAQFTTVSNVASALPPRCSPHSSRAHRTHTQERRMERLRSPLVEERIGLTYREEGWRGWLTYRKEGWRGCAHPLLKSA
uniref:Uncharacterized protein n=1 Tax=Timema genevievae TaxID=629358 RepID=A0A7R9K959_TIMGE|nr:unnamed protein product [Timema genevievae]